MICDYWWEHKGEAFKCEVEAVAGGRCRVHEGFVSIDPASRPHHYEYDVEGKHIPAPMTAPDEPVAAGGDRDNRHVRWLWHDDLTCRPHLVDNDHIRKPIELDPVFTVATPEDAAALTTYLNATLSPSPTPDTQGLLALLRDIKAHRERELITGSIGWRYWQPFVARIDEHMARLAAAQDGAQRP